MNVSARESRIFLFLRYTLSAMVEQIVVLLLYLSAGQLAKFYIAEARDNMLCDVPVVVIRGALANVRLCVNLKP